MAKTYTDGDGHQCYGVGTTVIYRCTSCDAVERCGREDDLHEVEIEGQCEACARSEAEATDSLGPYAAREDVVLCARCGRVTGRNLTIKLCDACDHELDEAYQRWVEDQARIAYERSLIETVQAAFWGGQRGH